MSGKRLTALVLFALVLGFASQAAAAYYLSYAIVQHRNYEDPSRGEFNRFTFEIKDDAGTYVTDGTKLESFTLTDSNGKTVEVPDLKFALDKMIYGEYDGKTGVWSYQQGFSASSSFYGTVAADLIQGSYHLKVKYAGFVSELDFAFNGLVDLPIIPASSIKTKKDKYGNFITEWQVPYSLSHTNPTLQTSVRTFIDILDKKGNYVGSLYVRVPTHMGCLFVPKSILDMVKREGVGFKLGIQLRTNDNNNRSYSKGKVVVLGKKATASPLDE